MTSRRPVVCSIGSTDPTGAAGIGVDLKVYQRLGVASVFVVAAVTAQNSARVARVEPLSPAIIAAQLSAIWAQIKPNAVRIGLLPDARAIRTVTSFLRLRKRSLRIVLDPVMRATSGRRFLGMPEVAALKRLLPLVDLVTPNAQEAAVLAGFQVKSVADAEKAARTIRDRYGCAALVKGGHLGTASAIDTLADRQGVARFAMPRLRVSMRGGGCVLSSAIAVQFARGTPLRRAVREARKFLLATVRQARPLGRGKRQLL